MAGRGFRLGGAQMFVVLSVLAVVVIVVLVRTAPPPAAGAGSARRWSGGPRSEADSVAYLDSLEEAVERRILRDTMTLADVATRSEIPVGSLVAELRLPASVSLTIPLRAVLLEHHLTLQDVRAARGRVERRLGSAAGRR